MTLASSYARASLHIFVCLRSKQRNSILLPFLLPKDAILAKIVLTIVLGFLLRCFARVGYATTGEATARQQL